MDYILFLEYTSFKVDIAHNPSCPSYNVYKVEKYPALLRCILYNLASTTRRIRCSQQQYSAFSASRLILGIYIKQRANNIHTIDSKKHPYCLLVKDWKINLFILFRSFHSD